MNASFTAWFQLECVRLITNIPSKHICLYLIKIIFRASRITLDWIMDTKCTQDHWLEMTGCFAFGAACGGYFPSSPHDSPSRFSFNCWSNPIIFSASFSEFSSFWYPLGRAYDCQNRLIERFSFRTTSTGVFPCYHSLKVDTPVILSVCHCGRLMQSVFLRSAGTQSFSLLARFMSLEIFQVFSRWKLQMIGRSNQIWVSVDFELPIFAWDGFAWLCFLVFIAVFKVVKSWH